MKSTIAWPFLRLYILTLMSSSTNAILNVFIPLRRYGLGATNTAIGIVMETYMLTAIVFQPWTGQIIARVGPIKVLGIILIINAIASIICGFTGSESYFVACVMQGVCTTFLSMSLQLGIIDALPEEHRSRGVSLHSLSSTIPNLIGPLVTVSIWNADNIPLSAIVIISIALTTTFFGYRVTFTKQEPNTSGKIKRMPFNVVTVFAQFFKNKELLNSGIIMVAASVVFGAVSTFIPLHAVSLGFANAGILLTIQAIAVVVARFYLRKYIPSSGMWYPKYMVSILSLLVIASFIIAFGSQVGAVVFYDSTILIGITQAMVYPTLTSYLSFVLPKVDHNMLLGLFIACADLGISLGDASMGPISDLVGFRWVYLICGMLIIVIMVMSLLRKPAPCPANSL